MDKATQEAARDTQDTAAEIINMIARRLAEGQNPATISAGIALSLTTFAKEADPAARAFHDEVKAILNATPHQEGSDA